jgi:hypothetical protein
VVVGVAVDEAHDLLSQFADGDPVIRFHRIALSRGQIELTLDLIITEKAQASMPNVCGQRAISVLLQ